MKLKTALLTLMGIITVSGSLFAQDPTTDMEYNRAVLRYYSGIDISNFESQDPVNLDNIAYYFTRSFEASLINCPNCEVDYTELYNYDLFNIVEHESKRLQSTPETFTFKNKYEITLFSINEVNSNLVNTDIDRMTSLAVERPFPLWVDNGNFESDFADYKRRVDEWANDFPEEFRSMTSSGSMFTIRKGDFQELLPERKVLLFNNPGGYLITD